MNQLTNQSCLEDEIAGLTVGPEEGRRKEALIHQSRERNHTDHVVGVKGQTAERLTAQLL